MRKLEEGSYFGEIALINGGMRTATIKTDNYCTVGILNKEHFFGMTEKSPMIINRLRINMITYDDQWKLYIIKLIKNVDYFEGISERILKSIYYDLKQEYYQEDDVIFNIGDPTNKAYFITQGIIDLYIPSEEGDMILLDQLKIGSSLGSYSLLSEQTRMFKAIAKTYCAVTVLTQADITRLKFMYGDELKSIDEAEEWVQENGVPFMDFRIYRQSRGLMIYKKILKDACRRLVNINRAVDSDVGEIIELLHSISANSFNKTTIPESMQQYVEETCNTMNEFQKRLSNIESK